MPLDPDLTNAAAVDDCLVRLAAGDLTARDRIIELCAARLRVLASRLLDRFPKVRRWDDTDDVFQNAAMRLHRALGAVRLESPRAVLSLAATQIQRELLDLARRHAGPESHARNHETNLAPAGGDPEAPPLHVERAADPRPPLDRWSHFHEVIAGLPPERRETFQLVWYLGADQKTVARLLDCSERTVRTRWREARDTVRAALDGRPPE
jgi:RNA polymerase sigma-70 factor (ECF subfamily)